MEKKVGHMENFVVKATVSVLYSLQRFHNIQFSDLLLRKFFTYLDQNLLQTVTVITDLIKSHFCSTEVVKTKTYFF